MTDHTDECSEIAIAFCRRINRSAATKFTEQGVRLDDIAIAAIYTAFDLAATLTGSPGAAVEWLRTAVDVQERSLLAGPTLQ
jgi:hypothetical protein